MRFRNLQTNARHGVAATELALWLPFLSLMFVIAIDYCRVFYSSQTIQNCACAGAMYAANVAWVDTEKATSAEAAVKAALAEGVSLNPPLQASNITVTTAGSQAKVTVTYEFPFVVNWPGRGPTLTITRSVTMAIVPAPGI
jgi:Flp pilus assembly protein TadG